MSQKTARMPLMRNEKQVQFSVQGIAVGMTISKY